MMKRILLAYIMFTVVVFGSIFSTGSVFANDAQPTLFVETQGVSQAEQLTPISVLVRDDCAHCQDEKEFLEQLSTERSDFEIIYHDIYTPEGEDLFNRVTEAEGLTKSTPITLLGNRIIQGFGTAETTGKRIKDLLDQSADKETFGFEDFLAAGGSQGEVEQVAGGVCDEENCVLEDEELLVDTPFFGAIDVKRFSLPVMASILGLIDGFNPCAMWVLVTFLLVLLQVGNKRKMLEIAGLFIVAEAIMYYLILNVWFTTWDFVGLDHIVTPIVGLIAIGGGIFFLYEGIKSDGTCQVTNLEQRSKIQKRIKDIASKPMTWAAAGGIIALAFSVNIIEFACSVGIPQAFTKIVEINNLSGLYTQFLMFLYILFYMIDDFIVFGIALYGADKLHLTTKYSKYSNIVGGVLMLVLGALLIFAPSLLRF